jgi:hypothetical protein
MTFDVMVSINKISKKKKTIRIGIEWVSCQNRNWPIPSRNTTAYNKIFKQIFKRKINVLTPNRHQNHTIKKCKKNLIKIKIKIYVRNLLAPIN